MIKIKSYKLSKFLWTPFLIALLLLLLVLTDPRRVPLPVLIAPFVCIGLIIYQIAKMILRSRTKLGTNNYAVRLFAISLSFLGVALLLLRSLHQLTAKDTLLVCGFTLAFWLYVWRADFLHK